MARRQTSSRGRSGGEGSGRVTKRKKPPPSARPGVEARMFKCPFRHHSSPVYAKCKHETFKSARDLRRHIKQFVKAFYCRVCHAYKNGDPTRKDKHESACPGPESPQLPSNRKHHSNPLTAIEMRIYDYFQTDRAELHWMAAILDYFGCKAYSCNCGRGYRNGSTLDPIIAQLLGLHPQAPYNVLLTEFPASPISESGTEGEEVAYHLNGLALEPDVFNWYNGDLTGEASSQQPPQTAYGTVQSHPRFTQPYAIHENVHHGQNFYSGEANSELRPQKYHLLSHSSLEDATLSATEEPLTPSSFAQFTSSTFTELGHALDGSVFLPSSSAANETPSGMDAIRDLEDLMNI